MIMSWIEGSEKDIFTRNLRGDTEHFEASCGIILSSETPETPLIVRGQTRSASIPPLQDAKSGVVTQYESSSGHPIVNENGYALASLPRLQCKPPIPKKLNTSHTPTRRATPLDIDTDGICTFMSLRCQTNKEKSNMRMNHEFEANDKVASIDGTSSTVADRDTKMMSSSCDLDEEWMARDIFQKEFQTDEYLQELKKHNRIDTNLTDSSKIVEKVVRPWEKDNNLPGISEVDLDEIFGDTVVKNNGEDVMVENEQITKAFSPLKFSDRMSITPSSSRLISDEPTKKGVERYNEVKFINYPSYLENGESLHNSLNMSRNLPNLPRIEDNISVIGCSGREEHDQYTNKGSDDTSLSDIPERGEKKSELTIAPPNELVDIKLKHSMHGNHVIDPTSTPEDDIRPITQSSDEGCNKENTIFDKITPSSVYDSCFSKSSEYRVLISFLDEVDRNGLKSLESAKENAQLVTKLVHSSSMDTIPKIHELNILSSDVLSQRIIDLSIRVEEKNTSISILRKELSNLRDQIHKRNKQTEETVKQKLKQQKEEFEGTVKRHQKFIDQLITDKKSLNQQCEGLIQEMRILEEKYHNNIQASERKHQLDMKKIREMQITQEKIRREKWMDNKTKMIKELTVKSIESEIHNMEQRHQQELADLRSSHKREIENVELKCERRTHEQCEALRLKLVQEGEEMLAHERILMQKRYERMVECEEERYQEQRKKLSSDHENMMKECRDKATTALIEKEDAIKSIKNDFDKKLQVITEKHASEIKLMKEFTKMNFEKWKNDFKRRHIGLLSEKEEAIRQRCRRERDEEIESIIERLENESTENKIQFEKASEDRIRKLEEEYENVIQDLATSENESKCKYQEAKSELLHYEETIEELRTNIRQLENQIQEHKEVENQYKREKNDLKETVKQRMNEEMEILKKELEQLKQSRDKEIQQLYSRVKLSVTKKDDILRELQQDHISLQEKCMHLENMLEQQRKEYLLE